MAKVIGVTLPSGYAVGYEVARGVGSGIGGRVKVAVMRTVLVPETESGVVAVPSSAFRIACRFLPVRSFHSPYRAPKEFLQGSRRRCDRHR